MSTSHHATTDGLRVNTTTHLACRFRNTRHLTDWVTIAWLVLMTVGAISLRPNPVVYADTDAPLAIVTAAVQPPRDTSTPRPLSPAETVAPLSPIRDGLPGDVVARPFATSGWYGTMFALALASLGLFAWSGWRRLRRAYDRKGQ